MKQKPNKHKQKVREARKMLTGLEKKLHVPEFQSKGWTERANARHAKEIKKQKSAQIRRKYKKTKIES